MPGEGRSSGCSPVWLQARLPPLYPKESAALQLLAASGDSLFAGAAVSLQGSLCCVGVSGVHEHEQSMLRHVTGQAVTPQ